MRIPMSENTNPLLAKVKLPGRTFQLPSHGAMYEPGVLAATVKSGEVQVHPMSALAEINLKNPDLLFNGKALEAVLAECVPAIKKPLELYGRDVDAVLFFLRLATYGPEYRIEVKHDCAESKQHSYTVDLQQLVDTMRQLDPTVVEAKRTVKLETGQSVYTRPMKFDDIVQLFHSTGNKKELTAEDVKELAVTNLLCMIEKVEDVTDRAFIEEWVRSLTTPMVNRITEAASELNEWGPTQVVTLKCKDCGEDMRVELPLNPVSFFTE
jgi:hypothetical protein